MPTTANRKYPYPALTDAPDGASQMQALAQSVDADVQAIATATNSAYVYAVGTVSGGLGQAIPDATSTTVLWTTVGTPAQAHNTGSWNAGVRTVALDGIYSIQVQVTYPQVNTLHGSRQATMYVSGTCVASHVMNPDLNYSAYLQLSYLGPLTAGQTITVFTFQSETTTQRLVPDDGACFFSMARISAL